MQSSSNFEAGIQFDSDGFLVDPSAWDEAVANRIASADGLGHLDDVQLGVLRALRQEYSKHRSVIALSHVCHLSGQRPDCMQHLFPNPREAWRVGGLPNPGEEAKAYL